MASQRPSQPFPVHHMLCHTQKICYIYIYITHFGRLYSHISLISVWHWAEKSGTSHKNCSSRFISKNIYHANNLKHTGIYTNSDLADLGAFICINLYGQVPLQIKNWLRHLALIVLLWVHMLPMYIWGNMYILYGSFCSCFTFNFLWWSCFCLTAYKTEFCHFVMYSCLVISLCNFSMALLPLLKLESAVSLKASTELFTPTLALWAAEWICAL